MAAILEKAIFKRRKMEGTVLPPSRTRLSAHFGNSSIRNNVLRPCDVWLACQGILGHVP
jgi:hypothetical protein